MTPFLRPIAHRGLHGAAGRGAVENTIAAFDAAVARGYGIELDVRAGPGGLPLVFHDATLERLTTGFGAVRGLDAQTRSRTAFRNAPAERIPTLQQVIERVAGRVPILVEIKSEWEPPDPTFLGEVARLARGAPQPLGLMSFDPAVMSVLRELAPQVPRGIVSGNYLANAGGGDDHWWSDRIGAKRAEALSLLLESGPVAPHFFAYDVRALPTPVTRYIRAAQGLPILAWTVRNDADLTTASRFADAPIFEGFLA